MLRMLQCSSGTLIIRRYLNAPWTSPPKPDSHRQLYCSVTPGIVKSVTLNFSKTAADCRVVQALYPMVNVHFEFGPGQQLIRRETDYAPMWQKPGNVLRKLLLDLQDFLPPGPFWERTRRRLGNHQQAYLIRRALFEYSRALRRGETCLCGINCRYPESPTDY